MEQPVVLAGIGEMGGVFVHHVATGAITPQEVLCTMDFDHEQLSVAILEAFERTPDHSRMGYDTSPRLAYPDRLTLTLPIRGVLQAEHTERA